MSKSDEHPYEDIAEVHVAVAAVVADLRQQIANLFDFSKAEALVADLQAEVARQNPED